MVAKKLSQIKKDVVRYVDELKIQEGVVSESVILYGSYARGTARAYSDIDIVVISKDLSKWPPIERLQMLSRLTAAVESPLEVIGYTPREIRERGKESIFWEEIMRTGVEIYKKAA